MWPDGVVVPAPALDQHLCLAKRGEDLAVEQLVPELGVEALAIPILPGTTRLDEQRYGAFTSVSDASETAIILPTAIDPRLLKCILS